MKLLYPLTALLTALSVSASPLELTERFASSSSRSPGSCLTILDAAHILFHWIKVFEGDVSQIKKVAAPDIKIYDDQVNFLYQSGPLGTPFIDGIPKFEEVVKTSPGGGKITVDHALSDCTSIAFRYTFRMPAVGGGVDDCGEPSSTNKGDPITYSGMDIMIVDPKTKKVTKAYAAFDALIFTFQNGLRTCYKKGADGLLDPHACACPGTCPV